MAIQDFSTDGTVAREERRLLDFFPWLQDENFQGGQVPAPWTNYCDQR